MRNSNPSSARENRRLPIWLSALLPALALAILLAFLVWGEPLGFFTQGFPPVEILNLEQVRVVETGFEIEVVNAGPAPLQIAQVLVDDAYWEYEIEPSPRLPRYGRANLRISYPWVYGEPHSIVVLTETGLTFETEVEVAVPTPVPGFREFLMFGLVGIYVGIIPVGLGMLWYPALRRLERKWIDGVLALTIGLLVFLLVDTALEGFEVGQSLPGFMQGGPLVLYSGLITWLLLMAVRSSGTSRRGKPEARGLARLIAISIGLHNLGEGLAIGAAFALGQAALGSFLIIGFTLHNITEGIGIAAPLLPRNNTQDSDTQAASTEAPFTTLLGLTLLAGTPAILGAWVGGFAYGPLLAAIFLGVGAGAILQVIFEVGSLLQRTAARDGRPLTSWINVGGFTLGLMVMYLTAFLVSF